MRRWLIAAIVLLLGRRRAHPRIEEHRIVPQAPADRRAESLVLALLALATVSAAGARGGAGEAGPARRRERRSLHAEAAARARRGRRGNGARRRGADAGAV